MMQSQTRSIAVLITIYVTGYVQLNLTATAYIEPHDEPT